MSQQLLNDFTRLLTLDTRACAQLFTRDAEFRTHLGTHELCFLGRHEILAFLHHVPRQITFRAEDPREEHDGFTAHILVLPDGLPPHRRSLRYSVEQGRFKRFHLRSH